MGGPGRAASGSREERVGFWNPPLCIPQQSLRSRMPSGQPGPWKALRGGWLGCGPCPGLAVRSWARLFSTPSSSPSPCPDVVRWPSCSCSPGLRVSTFSAHDTHEISTPSSPGTSISRYSSNRDRHFTKRYFPFAGGDTLRYFLFYSINKALTKQIRARRIELY